MVSSQKKTKAPPAAAPKKPAGAAGKKEPAAAKKLPAVPESFLKRRKRRDLAKRAAVKSTLKVRFKMNRSLSKKLGYVVSF